MSDLFGDVRSLWVESTTDPKDIYKTFKDLGLITYYGNNAQQSHYYLKKRYDLASLSPSKASVINFINRYGFEGDVGLVKRGVEGLMLDGEKSSLTDLEKIQIGADLGQYGFSFKRVGQVSPIMSREQNIHGNKLLMYEEITVGSVKRIEVTPIPLLKAFYLSKDDDDKSPFLEMVYFKHGIRSALIREKRHEVIKCYPYFTDTDTGRKTIIHEGDFIDETDMYGRAKDGAADLAMLTEFLQLDLAAKVSDKEIVTKLIAMFHVPSSPLEGDDEDEQDNAKSKALALRKVLTRKNTDNPYANESQVVAALEYEGDIPPVLHEIGIKRDKDWFESQKEATSDYIFGLNGIPKILASAVSQKNTMISNSGNLLREQFRITDVSLIRPLQEQMSDMWHPVFKSAAEFTGISELGDLAIEYPKKIERLVEDLLVSTEQNFNKNVVNNPDQKGG